MTVGSDAMEFATATFGAVTFEYAALSHVGLVRVNNEDSAYASPRLLMLADGMGGMAGGEIASALTVHISRTLEQPSGSELLTRLADTADAAQTGIRATVAADPTLAGMGTTFIAILSDGARVGLLHIGDSRAYLLRGATLRRLTADHTLVQLLLDAGRLTPAEALTYPNRSMIVKAINGGTDSAPDVSILDVAGGDRLLLCSDGLTDYVGDDRIAELLAGKPPEKAVFDLVTSALDAQSRDNVTCVVADVVVAPAVEARRDGLEPLVVGAASEKIKVPWASAEEAPLSLLATAVAHLLHDGVRPSTPVPTRRSAVRVRVISGVLLALAATAVVAWWLVR